MKNYEIKNNILTVNESNNSVILIQNTLDSEHKYEQLKINIQGIVVELFNNHKSVSHINIQREINLEKNSSLHYLKIQDILQSDEIYLDINIRQGDNSNLELISYELGNSILQNKYTNTLNNKNSFYNLNSLVKSKNNAKTINTINTIHKAKDTYSNINFKHSLDDNSKAYFNVNTLVENKAINAKAFQNSNTILLSDNASIWAQPHLQIKIDELEASHGVTTGTLDDEQLLYLNSRGISNNKAKVILLEAFEKQIYLNIKNEKLKDFLAFYKRDDYV